MSTPRTTAAVRTGPPPAAPPTAGAGPAPVTAPAARPRPAARRGALLAAALAAPAAMGVSGPSLALPDAAGALHVSPGTAAWLMTAYGLGMAVGTPLLSGTAGRRGPGRMITVGAVLTALGAALVLAAPAFGPLVAGRALAAVGAAGLNVAAFQLAARDGSGRSAGVVAIGSAVGGTLGIFLGAGVAGLVGWRAALVLPLLSLVVVAPTVRLAGPPDPVPTRPGTGGRATVLPVDVLRDRGFRTAAGLVLALSTVNFALLYGAPRRFSALTGWSPVPTGAAASVAALTGALLAWQLVRAAPALGPRRTRALLAAGGLVAALAAAFAPWPALVLAGSGLSALVTAGGQGLLTGAAVEGLPEGRRGIAVGLFNLAFLVGVAAGPALAAGAASFADQTVQFIY